MTQIIEKSATKLIEEMKSGILNSEEVVQAFLTQIEKVNPLLNAVVQQKPDEALLQAKQADEKIFSGQPLGKLHGLPITIKDFCDVEGYVCTYGTEGYKDRTAATSAFCVKKLLDEGAIIIGMTNSPELAGAYETSNIIYGTTNNPYDLECSPGGSSGGEAAILAANGSPLGLGSDGGGSIRLPAHFCGIAGIKPTQGLLSLDGISVPFSGIGLIDPHGTFGPMTRYVEDLKLSLPILAGYNFKDPTSLPMQINSFNNLNIKNLRVAVFTDNGIIKPNTDVCSVIENVAEFFSDQGCSLARVFPPNIERTFELFWKVYFRKGDHALTLYDTFKKLNTKNISSLQKEFIQDSQETIFSITDLYEHISEIAKFRFEMHKFMDDYDIILCPPCATPAKQHNTSFSNIKDYTYTMTYNLLGWPAGVVRCGQTKERLPIGVQIVAKPWCDNLVIDVLHRLEREFGGFYSPFLEKFY
ncbi:MAG: hypothetical protein B7Y25_03105 [Alphaproteobacteria bacterium 16-39-46]|nr:MAG: hypothetical protein B7Y25_03105 [Alphaproteobacteria bacterium 16-39-46]OZA43402.1 MAG: hypothetical protein B7X84_03305 [Alphaproteobacteria bacterium 17-39-52]HQS83891.1 amidase family protein [Alphaproteobacteria bacterium]HQS93720.1 amidase family protein [Alphaproteobacteria bacterium]